MHRHPALGQLAGDTWIDQAEIMSVQGRVNNGALPAAELVYLRGLIERDNRWAGDLQDDLDRDLQQHSAS